MAQKRRRFRFFRALVDFPTWMNLQGLRESGNDISKTFQDLRQMPPTRHKETFEEAMIRLDLTEEAVQKRMRQCYFSGLVFLACSLGLFVYALALLTFGFFPGAFIAALIGVLAGVFAYREAFWYVQMKKRKLGCTFVEFLVFITGRA